MWCLKMFGNVVYSDRIITIVYKGDLSRLWYTMIISHCKSSAFIAADSYPKRLLSFFFVIGLSCLLYQKPMTEA
jgi:hypothetical protein